VDRRAVGRTRRSPTHNLHLFDDNTGMIIVDPDFGALHEPCKGGLYLGPPKTDASARDITLPPFLVILLRQHVETHDHPHVFVTPQGRGLLRVGSRLRDTRYRHVIAACGRKVPACTNRPPIAGIQ
jgi:hypothetical protein